MINHPSVEDAFKIPIPNRNYAGIVSDLYATIDQSIGEPEEITRVDLVGNDEISISVIKIESARVRGIIPELSGREIRVGRSSLESYFHQPAADTSSEGKERIVGTYDMLHLHAIENILKQCGYDVNTFNFIK